MHLIGIAGPSCSGKTEIARWLSARLLSPVVEQDWYYPDLSHLRLEERRQVNFDDPDAVEHHLLEQHLRALAAGETIRAPQYDFEQHVRKPDPGERILPGPYLIVAGLFVLAWREIRGMMSTKLFVDAPAEVCLKRRLVRDVLQRGRSEESIRRQFVTQVLPMSERYVLPSRVFADLILDGEAPVSESGAQALAAVRLGEALRLAH